MCCSRAQCCSLALYKDEFANAAASDSSAVCQDVMVKVAVRAAAGHENAMIGMHREQPALLADLTRLLFVNRLSHKSLPTAGEAELASLKAMAWHE